MMKTPTAFFLSALVFVPGLVLAALTNGVENMRRRSTSTSDVVSQAILGTNVRVLRKERNADGEDWHEVETPDTYYKGWIISSALEFLKPGAVSGVSGHRA